MCNPKIVYCTQCGRRVGTWDGKSTINVICVCRNCDKQVIYYVDDGTTKIKDRPQRSSSSGMNLSY